MTFWGAVFVQWVNVKGWVMVIGTITAYAGIASFPWNIAIQVVVCLLLGVAATSIWTLSGSSLRSLMTSPKAVRGFNIVMAALLLASLFSGIHGSMMGRRAMQKRVPMTRKML